MSTYLRTLEAFGMQSRAIIEDLDSTFPPTNPTPEMTMEQIMYYSGQRSVVEWLKEKMEDQDVSV